MPYSVTKFPQTICNLLVSIHWKRELLTILVCFALVFTLQRLGGAYKNEFGGHPDEAGHYVTGLMVRDYLASGFHKGPMPFARDYYDHYPKVALGNWPPLFYVMQSAWTLIFPPTRASMLLLMAFLSTLTAMVLFYVLKSQFNYSKALLGSLLFLSLPLYQTQAAMLMGEVPVTLLALIATVFWGRFLDRKNAANSLAFGLFASLTILTKGNGVLLALVPPLALIFGRQLSLLKRPAFWIPALIVPILCGPWTWIFRKDAQAGWVQDSPGWSFTRIALSYYPATLVLAFGVGLVILAMIGFWTKLVVRREKESSGIWPATAALLCSTLIFQILVPCGWEARHLFPALPPMVLFIFAGADRVISWLMNRGLSPKMATASVLLVAGLAFFVQTFKIEKNEFSGFAPIATSLLSNPQAKQSTLLVSSDACGEGSFIAEVAMREKRPGHIVQRTSKALASSTWGGGKYQAKFTNEQAILDFLQKSPVQYLVLDTSLPISARKNHHVLLYEVVSHHPEFFVLEGTYSIDRSGVWQTNGIQLYSLQSNSKGSAIASQSTVLVK
jgi:Dolichyl-phosphate-mannose-protein mannosyltransferase